MGQSRLFVLFLSLIIIPIAWAGTGVNPETGRLDLCLTVEEEDGSPSSQGCGNLEVTNGTLTDDGDGNFSLSTGGGGGNSFETIAVPAGTDPVADSSTDTLTITETSFLTITGTAATDTIDITQVTTDLGTDGLIAANAVALGTDTTNAYVTDLTAGTAIDVSGGGGETATVTVDFDSTEVEATTWGAGGNASNLWTFNLSGTDPTVTWGSAAMTLVGVMTNDGTTMGADENLTIGTDTFTFSSGTSDFEISDDLSLTDADPHIQLIDSTASQDDFEWWANQSVIGLANVTDSQQLMHFAPNNDLFLDTYNCSALTNGGKLTTDGNGRVVCQDDTGAATSGDITSVGDVSTGAAFDGTQGTILTFNDADGDQTIGYDATSNDFELSDDLDVNDATPHVKLVDTTASQDDFELHVDGSNVFLTNVTDNAILLQVNSDRRSHITTPNAVNDRTATLTCGGTLSTSMDCEDFRSRVPGNCTLQSVSAVSLTAPTTQAIIIDVNECTAPGTCTSVWNADQTKRVTIPAGGVSGEQVAFGDTTLAMGSYIGFDLDQVGSGTTGADLTVDVVCRF